MAEGGGSAIEADSGLSTASWCRLVGICDTEREMESHIWGPGRVGDGGILFR